MKRSSFCALSVIALSFTALGPALGRAATLVDSKHGVPVQTQAAPQPRLVLPSRTEVLTVDWVDTRNAKIAIGGITYALRGSPLPNIVLAGGEQVTNIGYLKSGMRVKIRTTQEGANQPRLAEITVVS